MEDLNSQMGHHKIAMSNRKECILTGITDVTSFDLHEVVLETQAGMLSIKGDNLHVSRLTLEKGEVDITGTIDSLTYSGSAAQSRKNESMLVRLFR